MVPQPLKAESQDVGHTYSQDEDEEFAKPTFELLLRFLLKSCNCNVTFIQSYTTGRLLQSWDTPAWQQQLTMTEELLVREMNEQTDN